MKNPDLSYPIQIMIDEQSSLTRDLALITDAGVFRAATEERLAACKLAHQILNLYAAYQAQPLATHEVPRLPQ